MMSKMAAEIVLIDRDSRRPKGHVNDLRDADVFSHTTRIFVGDFSNCCSADVTIVTAGVSQSGQKSRMEGLRDTGAILHSLVNDVWLQSSSGILLIASNPVDVLTYAAWRWSGLPAGQAIDSGTSLDTSRFRRRFTEHCQCSRIRHRRTW
jgi:L-lactate dehydrogenase